MATGGPRTAPPGKNFRVTAVCETSVLGVLWQEETRETVRMWLKTLSGVVAQDLRITATLDYVIHIALEPVMTRYFLGQSDSGLDTIDNPTAFLVQAAAILPSITVLHISATCRNPRNIHPSSKLAKLDSIDLCAELMASVGGSMPESSNMKAHSGYGGTSSDPSTYTWRRPRYSARPFFLSALVVCGLCLLSLIREQHATVAYGNTHSSTRRDSPDISVLGTKNCHLVHDALDRCAYVKKHCPDEEAGVLSYLTLYYCDLPNAQPFAFVLIVLWLCLLFSTVGIAASDFFCVNLSTIASMLGMSESLAGVTFLAFGNGSPDVFSTFAAMNTNSGSLAIGELIGAAGFITAVIGGSMALVKPFRVARKSFIRDVGFFIAAAALTLSFLLDGHLSVWECAFMVVFYISYVVFVVFWHWWIGKSRRKRRAAAAAREHHIAQTPEVEIVEPFRDDPEVAQTPHPRHSRTTTRTTTASSAELSLLQYVTTDSSNELNADDAEEDRERLLGELNSNMRLRNRKAGDRKATIQAPIRPSLVGALEFRAALAGIEKSHSGLRSPGHARRHSYAPPFAAPQDFDQLSTVSDPLSRSAQEVIAEPSGSDRLSIHETQAGMVGRARAVSTNDMHRSRPDLDLLGYGTIEPYGDSRRQSIARGVVVHDQSGTTSPRMETADPFGPPRRTPTLGVSTEIDGYLAPPGGAEYLRAATRQDPPGSVSPSTVLSRQQSSPGLPKLQIPQSPSGRASPVLSPFPTYSDDPTAPPTRSRRSSIHLPAPGMSPGTFDLYRSHSDLFKEEVQERWKWWPYSILPTPESIFSTLFPTLYTWKAMTFWERCLGIVAAPSIFLLAVTLPVVESEHRVEDDDDRHPTLSLPPSGHINPEVPVSSHSYKGPITILEPGSSPDEPTTQTSETIANSIGDAPRLDAMKTAETTATIAVATERLHEHAHHTNPSAPTPLLSNDTQRHMDSPDEIAQPDPAPETWNRWLLLVQCVTAPAFCACIIYLNVFADDYGPKLLLEMCLWSLLASAVFIAIVLLSSTPTTPPKWRKVLCFAGFVVSVCWISTVANEVVGVLKWLGIVLNMSEAILGLTIFAVGSSLGDFVADITVARLGYPVMALSACFGGPMLNILLGIGLSGLYMTIHGAKERGRRNPGRPIKFKPFRIDVPQTLWVSGVSLLVTLCVLLVIVPARKWKMDRFVGFVLIGLWLASTTISVVLEVIGEVG